VKSLSDRRRPASRDGTRPIHRTRAGKQDRNLRGVDNREAQADQAKGDVKQAGEKVKDAFKD